MNAPVVRSTVMGLLLKCRDCLGSGILNVSEVFGTSAEVPIDRYITAGVPCHCPAGAEFRRQYGVWNKQLHLEEILDALG